MTQYHPTGLCVKGHSLHLLNVRSRRLSDLDRSDELLLLENLRLLDSVDE